MNKEGAAIAELIFPHDLNGFERLHALRRKRNVSPAACVVGLESALFAERFPGFVRQCEFLEVVARCSRLGFAIGTITEPRTRLREAALRMLWDCFEPKFLEVSIEGEGGRQR
jgi:hypothetical protein